MSTPARERNATSPRASRRTPPKPRVDTRLPIADATRGLVTRNVVVEPHEVVFVKSIIEASEGIASIFAETGGHLAVASPANRVAALDVLLADLATEVSLTIADRAEVG